MNLQVVFLQPRNPTQSWPTDPNQGTAPTVGGTGPDTNTTVVVNTGASGVDQDRCESASKNMLIAAGGYDFAASLLGVVLFLVMRRKLWATVFGRYLTGILVAAVGATTLLVLDPVRADELTLCLNNPDLARYIFLSGSTVSRALVLGLVPSFLVTLGGCWVANRT
jgi:hypothetical protein